MVRSFFHCWYLLGWSLAYGGDVKTAKWEEGGFEDCDMDENTMGCGDGYADNGVIGGAHMFAGSGFLGKGEEVDKAWAEGVITPTGLPTMWFFQWAFCTAGCSIVSGGVAERIRFPAYMLFAFCMTSFIYPVVVCSTWGYGWLETFKKDSKGNPIAVKRTQRSVNSSTNYNIFVPLGKLHPFRCG